MTKDELMEALLVERYTSPWWTKKPEPRYDNSEFTCARRRRLLDDAMDREWVEPLLEQEEIA